MKLTQSPVTTINLFEHELHIKRDDLLHPEFSGNKARKFHYYLANEFPQVETLVGYGSCQANSLWSLACLVELKGWHLKFYVDRIPTHLKENPVGNYAGAIAKGAEVIAFPQELNLTADEKQIWLEQKYLNQTSTLLVPEGGRCEYARYGVYLLAQEIEGWCIDNEVSSATVFLPSGTGTTAFYLNEYLSQCALNIQVVTCPVVGEAAYLQKQFQMLATKDSAFPIIVSPDKKYHFGNLYPESYAMWQKANTSGVEFELLYDPVGLITLEQHINSFDSEAIIYLHQGGLKGNETMIQRYKRKGK
ncbi:1-aminocyclopropane-1-carboxylate deaminase/D-cysteine desulfhydrase [Parashewanella curva]|uniref:1-aminocyclopropane-1-carboxylate deaminase/D-cysteine desulfhydrase n=1 Tax=Parashewanella curva TaxID=2338552 RepID=A0A3L8PZB1_9GAMM|nr:1-aminocyclopropane-1-carboxylate deaminase/D-cysteine desulfhydrase [Parashewanella curva]RLV60645.1 1-aminocyclopropane-1-carboxylate deaminase/D-cysteine desulfhydrase [Parashewanella curva]